MDDYGIKSEPQGRRGAWVFGGAFAVLLAVLMFLSGTIYQYNLPQVSATRPSNGYLNKRETSSGYADWETVEKVYSPIAGKISEVCVVEGDRIKKGQTLFRLSFDRSEAERRLREIENSRAKLEIDIQGLYLRIERAERSIADSQASKAESRRLYDRAASKVTTSNEVELIDNDIRKAEQTLADTIILYEAGAVPRRDVTAAEDSIESLRQKRDSTIKSQTDQLEKDAENLESMYKNISSYEKPIADSRTDLAQLDLDLQSRKHDMISLDMQMEPYVELLAQYDANPAIVSNIDGIVLTVSFEKGQNVAENALAATVAVGNSYIVGCSISLENNFVFLGDTCELSNTAHALYGDIISIAPGDRGKALEIRIISDEVTVGETFEILFRRQSDVRYTLVPNGALNQDSNGYYLNQVKKRAGLLGNEFFLDRIDVFIGDSDSQNTVITGGIRFFEPIMLTSDKPVQPGDIVTLLNESDFFAD